MFLARLDRLRALREFLESFCADAALGRDPCLRLNLVLEELFTNTVRHGHRGDSDSPVWVTLSVAGANVSLTYEDAASAPKFMMSLNVPGWSVTRAAFTTQSTAWSSSTDICSCLVAASFCKYCRRASSGSE